MTAAIGVDAAVTRALGTGIDPEDLHKFRGASPRRTPLHTRSRGASLGWRGPLHPARLTPLRSLFAARAAPFAHSRSALARRSRVAAEAARVARTLRVLAGDKLRGASRRRTSLHTRSRGASLGWRGPLHPARLTPLRSLFAARAAPFAHSRSALARRSRVAAEAARVARTLRVLAGSADLTVTPTRPRSPSPRCRRSSTPSWCLRAPRAVPSA